MNPTQFGLTMLLVGMGGTLLTLWILSLIVSLLTRICQPKNEGGSND